MGEDVLGLAFLQIEQHRTYSLALGLVRNRPESADRRHFVRGEEECGEKWGEPLDRQDFSLSWAHPGSRAVISLRGGSFLWSQERWQLTLGSGLL